MIKMHRHAAQYDGRRPENWMMRIVQHVHLDLRRERSRRPATVSLANPIGSDENGDLFFDPAASADLARAHRHIPHFEGPEESMMRKAGRQALNGFMCEIDPQAARILSLVVIGGMGYAEVADAMGKPLGTIRSKINRFRRRAREAVAENPRLMRQLELAAA